MVTCSVWHNAPDSSVSLFTLSEWFADALMSLQVLSLRDSEEICHAAVTKWSDDANVSTVLSEVSICETLAVTVGSLSVFIMTCTCGTRTISQQRY